MKRRITIIILVLVAAIIGNGCYYVFHGQFRSAEKIRQGKALSVYEIGSIYSMHLAVCTAGWFFSPEATKEVIGMSFKRNRGRVLEKDSDFFLRFSSAAEKVYGCQDQNKKRAIAFNGDVSYMYGSPDRRLALAVNPGILWCDNERVYLQVEAHYPKCYNTHIGLPWGGRITINECLFSYLEDKEILHPYTLIYSCPIPRLD